MTEATENEPKPKATRRRTVKVEAAEAEAPAKPGRAARAARAAKDVERVDKPNQPEQAAKPAKSTKAEDVAKDEKPKATRRRTVKAKAGEEAGAEALSTQVEASAEASAQSARSQGEERIRTEQSAGQGSYGRGKSRQHKQQGGQRAGNQHQGYQHQGKNERRNNRNQRNNRRDLSVPQTSREDLEKLKVAELRAKAEELGVEHKGLLKAALIDAVFDASMKAEGFIAVEGVLDILADGYGFLRTNGYLPSENDVYVGQPMIRRNGLRKGDVLAGQTRPSRPNEKFCALHKLVSVNGADPELAKHRPRFADMTPIFPDERLVMEHGKSTITARVIDLTAPIGKGQRGLIVSPPKAGKTTILKDIAAAIAANNPEVHLMCLLVDERPEEVTDMERSIKGEVMASTFDMPSDNHIQLAEMVIERAKRLVENGEDVVILLDSITRLARAYNLAQPASGRVLSGGVDSTALYPPKKFLGAARNIEGGGSLTILASALVETGSKMDEVIFEEFKGTGNMEVRLDRQLADRRIFPAIDPVASGTRREDLLLDPQEAPLIWAVRRILANRNNTERAMEMLIKSLYQTHNNQEFIVRAAKKAQGRQADEVMEL